MTHGPLNFRQRDVTAIVKAVEKAGLNVARVEIDPEGKIAAYVGDPIKGDAAKVNLWKDHLDAQEAQVRSKLRGV